MRLDKFLSNENIGSRKAVGTLVRSGAVAVNGQAVRKSDIQITPEKDEITVNGKPARASYEVKVGDQISLRFGVRTVTVEVLSVQETVRQADATALYREVGRA